MELDEVAARVIRTYWALLLVATVVPLVAVYMLMDGRTPPAAAQARVVVPGGAAAGAAGDNGVSAAVSTVKAFATGHDLLAQVIRSGRLARDPDKVAKQITVKGLGTSTVVELSVKDPDPAVALKLTQSIATETVHDINTSNQSAIQNQLGQINQQITALEKQQADASPGPPTDRILTQLTDLRASRSDLRTQLSTAGNASIAQPAIAAPKTDPKVMMTAVAGLGGLVLGILAAVVAEMVRPTVPGQRRVARRLDVPLLGRLGGSPAETAALGRRILLAARRAGAGQVTVVSAQGGPLPAELVSQLAEAVYGDRTRVVPSASVASPSPASASASASASGSSGSAGGGKSRLNGRSRPSATDGEGEGGEPRDAGAAASDETPSSTVVRAAGPAVMTREADGPVSPLEAARPVEARPVEARAVTPVHAFEDVDPSADVRCGVVAVAGPVTPVAGLESVRDLVAASGWPLLGVVATSRKIKG
ncbi:hypothetical protein DZF91_16200 [Actinomadura logoneensis]|uniref:Polysaccharide chain length determinant N-terminal domain-containing protein n=1 Tax=Actinomadura logoneensis TaxID=2293572 RepID=A0A372JKQ6_9ACTN|nr:hypothetical protein [Actinomadura logoneensis]RFU40612.1 hypothetical protein DZF91_16200 [Actinomadura logoneensis]